MPYDSVGSASSEEEAGARASTAVVVVESEAELAMEMCTKMAHEYYTAAYGITVDLLQAPLLLASDSAAGNVAVSVENRQSGLVNSLRDYMLKLTRLVEEQARNQSLSMVNEVNAAEKRASNKEKELILLKQKHVAAMTLAQQEKEEARKQVRLLEEELQRVASQHRAEVSQRVASLRKQMMKDYDQAARTKTTVKELGAFQQLVSEQARDLELLQAEKRKTKDAQIRLESQLQSVERERQFFSRSVQEAMKKNSALEVCQKENEARIRQAQEKVHQLEAAANAMHAERQELQEQMHHRTVDLGTKTTVCTHLEAEVVALRKKNEELEAKVKEDTEIQNIRSKLWETAQAEAVKKDASHRDSLSALQDEFAAMADTLRSEARDAWAGLQKELLEKEQTINSLLKDLSNAKVQLKNRNRELATWQDAASQAAELTEQLADKQRQSEAELKKLTAERDREEELKRKATSTCNKSVAAAKEMKAELQECNTSLSEAKKANAELQGQISALKDTIADHADAQATVTKLLELSRGEIEGLVSALNESKEEIKTYKAAVADLPTLQTRLQLTEKELDEAKSQNAVSEASLMQWEERLASQEAVHAALKKQHQDKDRRVLELSESLEHHVTELARAKENIESFEEERRQFKDMVKSVEQWEKNRMSEKEELHARISELEGVQGRVEFTNHALVEAKESIKTGIEEKRALESAIVKCEALLSASEEATRNLQAAYVLAMRALVPSLVRNRELIGQKNFLTFQCRQKEMRIDGLENELANIAKGDTTTTAPPLVRKKKSFRVAVIAVLAANRLSRFIGIPSALLPMSAKDGSAHDAPVLNFALHQKNSARKRPASHWLGEKIRGQENKHAVTNLASCYNPDFSKEFPQIAMPATSDADGHASRSNEQHMLLQLLLHFQKDDMLDTGSLNITRHLAHSGLATTPQNSLTDSLLKGALRVAGNGAHAMARSEQVDHFIHSRAQTAAKLSAAEKKVEDLERAALDSARKITELRGEAERLRERERSLSETVEALDEEKATMMMLLKAESDAAQLALEKLRAEHASLKTQHKASVAEISGYKVRSKVLSEKLNRMALRVKKLSVH